MSEKNLKHYFAHSYEGKPVTHWQKLEDHLNNVAKLASEFAEPFGGQEWARLAGFWHDVGKYSNEFQKKLFDTNGIECHLETKPGKVIHSQAGGHLAQKVMSGGMERIFCWLIMGHHAGLADFSSSDTGAKALEPKMRHPCESEEILKNVPDKIKAQKEPTPPEILLQKPRVDISFLIRMLFSCVVDADFLDTEAFMDSERKNHRQSEYPTLSELLAAFDRHMDGLCHNAEETAVNQIRAQVLARCREMADCPPSAFSLTVPTGGGKTLASLAFALRHAMKHEKRRIIYVIPYTSIIEQTASVFRNIPGFENSVLEHHCNVWDDDETKETVRRRLASENWDVPIVVTTSVQFFESLYAYKTSRCRKLHNIANSVVIFDEAQCFPPQYLRPVVSAIRELHRHYGVTPVLCTATQPVLTKTESFDFKFREGFESVIEIVERPDLLTERLQRVYVERFSNLDPVTYEQIAESIRAEGQSVLCIVNRKQDARMLSQLLPEEQTIHLSTNMCAEHRFQTLEKIKQRLSARDHPLFVVSTSLVEAGVDLDFPVVYRALAGLDSIAQAAGRCNREGKLPNLGKTIVFVPQDQPAYVLSPASLAREHLREERLSRIFQPETFARYFEQRFFQLGEQSLDEKNIIGLLDKHLEYSFRTAAERFRLIDDGWQLPLIVPFGEAPEVVDRLIEWDARRLFRKLQRYTVSIPKKVMWLLLDEGHARELPEYPGTYYLLNKGLYTDRFGFIPPDELDGYEPDTTII
ncbi:MAG: CRISPR-associated helicase Cas3' [Candidatus Marinimicrobia bacterium]|nr:CRISPR-associated helicase Cas3' [Candidatus Neomarinimicrobiota bacterium]